MSQKIAYQGEPGSNSNIACTEKYPHMESVPCARFEDALALVASGEAELAMIPIENSLAGRVADIHTLLPQSDLQIIDEHFLRIRFDLLGIPGAILEDAREVYSHVHALGQCRGITTKLGLIPVVTGDTAGSAREIKEWNDPTKLSFAPPGAAELYGLQALARGVEDDQSNTTRFVVLAGQRAFPDREELSGDVMTSLIFRVNNIPSALYKALGGFATNGVNMVRLESYMVGAGFAATQFMVDIEGHPQDEPVRLALEELSFFTSEVTMLGVYPAHPHRKLADASNRELVPAGI
ncbi:prephenate dehydratase [Glutamicibacter sp. MNS18]|uniref:prephenate dehydratase n=1 Tax=Glutamicibacter sp. MNS18 TaxID=2989817 RepID=UPI0022361C42|nr:prephenate dehydratase [Glutamicibacter sp. MNS18]MCW4467195.1 prephenate dehydratase [Glutamicibacter sp. MNS18]